MSLNSPGRSTATRSIAEPCWVPQALGGYEYGNYGWVPATFPQPACPVLLPSSCLCARMSSSSLPPSVFLLLRIIFVLPATPSAPAPPPPPHPGTVQSPRGVTLSECFDDVAADEAADDAAAGVSPRSSAGLGPPYYIYNASLFRPTTYNPSLFRPTTYNPSLFRPTTYNASLFRPAQPRLFPLPFLDLFGAASLPFLDLSMPLHCLSLTFSMPLHCLSLTFSMPLHCLSFTFRCLFTAFP